MKIITIPHTSLRKKAEPITTVDAKLIKLVNGLKKTLHPSGKDPRGVGLAAPQVNVLKRVLAIKPKINEPVKILINPVISLKSEETTFESKKNGSPDLEGCLSMPDIWGPVPRFEWVEVEFDELDQSSKTLIKKTQRFNAFAARVVQHEIDHLEGILFTDYSLEYDLPVYIDNGKKLIELKDRSLLELI